MKLHFKRYTIGALFLLSSAALVWEGVKLSPREVVVSQDVRSYLGQEAYKDTFAVIEGEIPNEDVPHIAHVLGESDDSELVYKKNLIELPLASGDYYYGKYLNAAAAARELNAMGVLKPGDRKAVIGNGYITMSSSRGYVDPGGDFMYASGVCWATSSLGTLMDEVNKEFNLTYGVSLFVFQYGDRLPHPHAYATYRPSNWGYGYSVVKRPGGYNSDYRFTVNPALADDPVLKDIKVKIVMVAREDNPNAFLGQAIGGYVMSNVDW